MSVPFPKVELFMKVLAWPLPLYFLRPAAHQTHSKSIYSITKSVNDLESWLRVDINAPNTNQSPFTLLVME